MAYRKLKIENKTYEYVIGKSHTKVKGVGATENSKICSFEFHALTPCRDEACNCEPWEYVLLSHVRPSDIKIFIEDVVDCGATVRGYKDSIPPKGFETGKTYSVEEAFPTNYGPDGPVVHW